MAISFPTAPIVGQVYEYGDYRYTWDGTKWTSVIKYGSSAVKIQSATPPGAPEPGLQWFDDDSGLTYIWHVNEGTAQGQWVEDAPQGLVDAVGNEILVTAAGSTTARTLTDREADVINVRDFGVIGDGITDDSAGFKSAVRYAAVSGKKLVSDSSMEILITELPDPITEDNFYADLGGATILCNIPSSSRGNAIFRLEGSPTFIATTLASDSVYNRFPVADASQFAIGDYVAGKYSVNQVRLNTPSNGVEFELVGQVTNIEGNTLVLTHSSAYPRHSSPSAGGVFNITRVDMNTGARIKNFTRRDIEGVVSDFQAVATYLSADFVIENATSVRAGGSHFIGYFSTDFVTIRNKTVDPQSVDAGRGYCEQYITCSNAESINAQGIHCRHTVDYSDGTTNMVCREAFASENSASSFGNHGGWESFIDYIDCSVHDGEGFSFSRNGAEFGSHGSDFRLINCSTLNCNYSILGLRGSEPPSNKNISVINPQFKGQTTGYFYAIEINMDGHSIQGGVVEGGIRIIPTQTDDSYGHGYTNMSIKGVTITGDVDDNNAIEMSNMLENTSLLLSDCYIRGSIEQISTNFSVEINGGTVRLPSAGFYKNDTGIRYATLFSMKDTLIELPANFAVTDSFGTVGHFVFKDNIVRPENSASSYSVNMTTISGGIVEIIGNTAACSFDITGNSGRITCSTNTDHQTISYGLPLLTLSGANNRLIFTENMLTDSSVARLVVDSGATGLQLALSNNIHQREFDFTGVTFRGGSVVGNSLLSGTQTIDSSITIVPDTNFGYSN